MARDQCVLTGSPVNVAVVAPVQIRLLFFSEQHVDILIWYIYLGPWLSSNYVILEAKH